MLYAKHLKDVREETSGAAEMQQWYKGPRPETAATTGKKGKWRRDFPSLRSSDKCVVMYRRRFYQATDCLSKAGISVETCLPSRCSAAGGFQTVIGQRSVQCVRFPQDLSAG
jgi:hypothetical protein